MRSGTTLHNVFLLICFGVAGTLLYGFGCRLLDTNGYSNGCPALLVVLVAVFLYLTVGALRSAR